MARAARSQLRPPTQYRLRRRLPGRPDTVRGVASKVRFVAVAEVVTVWEEDGEFLLPNPGSRIERLDREWIVSDRVMPRRFEPPTIVLRLAAPGEGE